METNCKGCGVDIQKSSGVGKPRRWCQNCKPKRRDLDCKCKICGKEWIMLSTFAIKNIDICVDCKDSKWCSKTHKICITCGVNKSHCGRQCVSCKNRKVELKKSIGRINKEQMIEFDEFMTRINRRGGLASRDEIFVELLGWSGLFLNIDWYGGTPSEQIEKMWKDLNKKWPVVKQLI